MMRVYEVLKFTLPTYTAFSDERNINRTANVYWEIGVPMFVPLARAAIILTPGANTSGLIRLLFVGPLELKVAIASLLEEAHSYRKL